MTINDLPGFTDRYLKLFTELAIQNKLHIIGGTHVIRKGENLYNVAHLFYPDGRVAEQAEAAYHTNRSKGMEYECRG